MTSDEFTVEERKEMASDSILWGLNEWLTQSLSHLVFHGGFFRRIKLLG